MLESGILLALDGTVVGTFVCVGGWFDMAVVYGRYSSEVISNVAFQVLGNIDGVQVPFNDGGKLSVDLCREVLQKELKRVFVVRE